MRIIRHDGMNNRGFAFLVWRALTNLEQSGYGEDSISVHYQDKAIVCYEDKVPVGFISYVIRADESFLFVKLAYVEPEFRQATRYHIMMTELIAIAKEEKVAKITCVIDVDNDLSKAVHEARGFVKVAETWDFVIPAPVQLTNRELKLIDNFIKTDGPYDENNFGF